MLATTKIYVSRSVQNLLLLAWHSQHVGHVIPSSPTNRYGPLMKQATQRKAKSKKKQPQKT